MQVHWAHLESQGYDFPETVGQRLNVIIEDGVLEGAVPNPLRNVTAATKTAPEGENIVYLSLHKDHDAGPSRVGRRYIQPAVSVEIHSCYAYQVTAGRRVGMGREGSRWGSQQHRNGVRVSSSYIKDAVTVEITNHNCVRSGAGRIRDAGLECSIAIAEENRDRVRILIDRNQIQFVVAVDIGSHHSYRISRRNCAW